MSTVHGNGRPGGEETALPAETRVAIIGSGFAGLGMAIRLKQAGVEDFVILERAEDVGGTWRDNTYPGCQCDIPSHLYSFSFAPNPDWSHTYSPQPEIWDYLRRVARDHGVLPHVHFNHEATQAEWDEEAQRWRIETTGGKLCAQFLVGGMGALSEPSLPEIPGLDRFEGPAFHSAQWDHEADLRGKRVAVIGTGASAIQLVPKIQPEVGALHLFQRTPAWVVPHSDRPLTGVERRIYRRLPLAQRAVRGAVYWMREALVPALARNPRLIKPIQAAALRHLRKQVPDPELRRKLTPDYTIGCKRILPSNDYYPALTQPNVELVTDGIREVREGSIVTADGTEREVDAIVFGTGFKVTDMPIAYRVRGREGRLLAEEWKGSPRAYLGTVVAGYPNLFLLTGPNTGLGHNSMVFMIESQLQYIVDCLRVVDERGLGAVEVREDVQEAYNEEVQGRMRRTVWSLGGCSSWYLDATGRNSTLWPGFTFTFRRRTSRFRIEDYEVGAPAREPVAVAA